MLYIVYEGNVFYFYLLFRCKYVYKIIFNVDFFLGARIILNMGIRYRSFGLGRKRRYIKVIFG